MKPSPLAAVLRQLADLALIRGSADAPDLGRAADALAALPPAELTRLQNRAERDSAGPMPGIPPSVQWRLREVALGGGDDAVRAARSGIPSILRRLLELGAVTTAEAASLSTQVSVATLADLHAALDDGRAERRLPPATVARLSQAAEALTLEVRPIPLGRALDLLEVVQSVLKQACPELTALAPAGDARRFEPLVLGLALVGRASDTVAAIGAICAAPGVDDVLARTARRAVLVMQHTEIDVRVAAPDEFGTMLFAATGSREHIRSVMARRGRRALASREEEVYAQAGLAWIAPELRNGTGEVEAAASNALPRLIERTDIRGDLHMHTTYSDGQDTLEAMVAASCAAGYEYIAITDHSETAGASRTLMRSDVARQRDELARIRERYPQIAILHGVEVDILPDGGLDFPDEILERFDIVLASLHDAARHDGPLLTRRCLQAIRHPLVNVITHPANRLVGRRGGYPMDYDALFAAAAETGTALEVDGAPNHLDLDGEQARAAAAAGVTLTVDSDCHRARLLERQMQLGVGTARRGWLEPRHVLNTRPADAVRAFVRAKRER